MLGDRNPRIFTMNRLGEALSLDPEDRRRAHMRPRPIDSLPEAPGPPVHALVVYNANPAAVTSDQRRVLEGLERKDLLTVVLEHFQTDTADYADLVLPATTRLEHWDVLKPYGHLFLAANEPAIAPVGESLPNSEISRRIARGLGYGDACFGETDGTILKRFVDSRNHPCMEGISWDGLRLTGFHRLNVPSPYTPFAHGSFPTPSGRCELYSEAMAEDGDVVTLHNERGSIDLPLSISRDIVRGTVVVPSIWWNKLHPKAGISTGSSRLAKPIWAEERYSMRCRYR